MSTHRVHCLLLTGDDSISLQKARDEFVAGIAETHTDFEEVSFDSSRQSLDEFLADLLAPSLFAQTRLFHIRQAMTFNEKEYTLLLSSIPALQSGGEYLVIDAYRPQSDKRPPAAFSAFLKKFRASAKKSPHLLACRDFPKPKPYQIPEWITTHVPRLFGRTIQKQDAELLVDLAGTDLGCLHSELLKMDLLLPPGASVDSAIIRHVTSASRSAASSELAQALGTQDLARSLEIIESMYQATFSVPGCIRTIFVHFWALFRIRAFARANPTDISRFMKATHPSSRSVQNEIGLRIGIAAGLMAEGQSKRVFPVLIKPGLVNQARRFKDDQLRLIIKWLYDFDLGIKTGQVTGDKSTLQLLCYKIIRVEHLSHAF